MNRRWCVGVGRELAMARDRARDGPNIEPQQDRRLDVEDEDGEPAEARWLDADRDHDLRARAVWRAAQIEVAAFVQPRHAAAAIASLAAQPRAGPVLAFFGEVLRNRTESRVTDARARRRIFRIEQLVRVARWGRADQPVPAIGIGEQAED